MGWIELSRAADILGLLGFVLTLVGLALTFYQARESRKSADEAKFEAQKAREYIRKIDLVTEATFALSAILVLKESMEEKRWGGFSRKISDLRQYVVSVRALIPASDIFVKSECEKFSLSLTNIGSKFSTWQIKGAGGDPWGVGGRNYKDTIVMLDGLSDLLIEVRNSVGGRGNG